MIYPTILTDSPEIAQKQLDLVAGKVEVVQLDYIDGSFADEVTLSPAEAAELNFRGARVDLHIQTNDPIEELNEVLQLAPVLRTVVAQVERMPSQRAFVEAIKINTWKVGLSLDLFTPVLAIDDDIWPMLDMVQIMGIYAGSQQQPFQLPALKKIAETREQLRTRGLTAELVVDGGINLQTAAECKAAGADSFAVGSFLWSADNPTDALFSLQQVK
jgi:ribulose-phosphate 3-epimerase